MAQVALMTLTERACSVNGCDRRAQSRGWCNTHYGRWLRHGDPGRVILASQRRTRPMADRFWEKVDKTDSCWLWLGTGSEGYGSFSVRRDGGGWVPVRAHRIAYELLVGPVREGLQLDHLCRNRACVNPAHLEPVTCRENLLRGQTQAARNAAKTHCVNGHEFTAENTYVAPANGVRLCRACRLQATRKYQAGRRAS